MASGSQTPSGLQAPFRLIFWGFLAIAAFFLISEHWAHALPYLGLLPWLLLLACPILMYVMMRGMHGHDDDGQMGRKS